MPELIWKHFSAVNMFTVYMFLTGKQHNNTLFKVRMWPRMGNKYMYFQSNSLAVDLLPPPPPTHTVRSFFIIYAPSEHVT